MCSMIPDIDELCISLHCPEDSLVASPSVLHEVRHPNRVGRVNWEWERNQRYQNATKEFGVKTKRKSTFEMKARRRQVLEVIVVVVVVVVVDGAVVDDGVGVVRVVGAAVVGGVDVVGVRFDGLGCYCC